MWSQRIGEDWRDLAQLAIFAKSLKYTAQFASALGKLEFQAGGGGGGEGGEGGGGVGGVGRERASEKIVKENILNLKWENYEISVCLSGFICVSVCVFVFG